MVVVVVSKQLLLEQTNKGQHWQLNRVFRTLLINNFDEKYYIEIQYVEKITTILTNHQY